jgi:glycosyltransferase involved in cell wall biosynthesis
MKIGIVALGFMPGMMGGTEVYLRSLIRMSQFWGSETEPVLFVSATNRTTLAATANHSVVLREIDPTFGQRARRGWVRANRMLHGQYYLGRLEDDVNFGDIDVLHYPFCISRPRPQGKRPAKTVITIHDLQHVEYPQFFSRKEIDFREREYGLAVNSADLILTDSQYSRTKIIQRYGLDSGRVKVIYPGVEGRTPLEPSATRLTDYLAIKKIQQPYMYYPAATWPHKNHKRLLLALRTLVASEDFQGSLVLSGLSMQDQNEIVRLVNDLDLSRHVRFVGFVPEEEMGLLYAGARMLVFPSLYEGFGFPVVESMLAGLPVLCSNCTSLPEIGADAVEYCDATDVHSLATSILRLWSDDDKRGKLRALGMRRGAFFDLSARAAELRQTYESLGV